MKHNFSENEVRLWTRLMKADEAALLAQNQFLSGSPNYLEIVREALLSTRRERVMALKLAERLTIEEKKLLIRELVQLSMSHALGNYSSRIITSIPKAWLLENIEEYTAPMLTDNADDYRQILELYCRIDHSLAMNLAMRAMGHSDADVREAGQDFCNFLSGSSLS